MKVNLNQKIPDYKGGFVMDEKGKLILMRDVVIGAINMVGPGDEFKREDKTKGYQISIKLMAKEEVDLTVDERSHILSCIGKVSSPIVLGTLTNWFDK